LTIIVRVDPDRALELLHQVDFGDHESSGQPALPQMQVVRQVFQVLVRRDGEAALPVLEREAAFIGSAGHYPYSALGYAASGATSRDWSTNRQHAIEVQQSLLDLTYTRYSQTAHD